MGNEDLRRLELQGRQRQLMDQLAPRNLMAFAGFEA